MAGWGWGLGNEEGQGQVVTGRQPWQAGVCGGGAGGQAGSNPGSVRVGGGVCVVCGAVCGSNVCHWYAGGGGMSGVCGVWVGVGRGGG